MILLIIIYYYTFKDDDRLDFRWLYLSKCITDKNWPILKYDKRI